VQFVGADGNGKIVDVEDVTSSGNAPTTVTLLGGPIKYVYLHHLPANDEDSCELSCMEPYISEMKACGANVQR
jgi:hypothetical protein